jgi:hypothetical protein
MIVMVESDTAHLRFGDKATEVRSDQACPHSVRPIRMSCLCKSQHAARDACSDGQAYLSDTFRGLASGAAGGVHV